MFRNPTAVIACLFVFGMSRPAFACDLCAIYNSIEVTQPKAGSIKLGLSDQFSYQGRVQDSGKYLPNDSHQHLASSITQILLAYDLTDRLSFQSSLPYINRRFKRVNEGGVERGTSAGIGDLNLLAKYDLIRYQKDESHLILQLLGGIKLPTGDTDRLKEELDEDNGELLSDKFLHHGGNHHQLASAVHGHDIALGTGSYDFPVGASFLAGSGRTFFTGELQYFLRTEGDFNYQYANDLNWNVGPAYYVLLEHESAAALKADLLGEHKREDSLSGEQGGDTGINSLFFSPGLAFSLEDLTGEVAFDVPLNIHNSGVQTVTSYRLRAGLTYRF